MSDTPRKTKPPALTTPRKLGYGVVESGTMFVEIFLQLYLLKFYTDVVGLEVSLAAQAMVLAAVWDAITDPLMGIVSDRTRHPMGRRRLPILLGGIGLAIFFPLLFNPPALESQTGKFFFLLCGYMLINTSMTVNAVPHAALLGDMARDTNERTNLYSYRLLFATVGMMLGTILPSLLFILLGPGSAESLTTPDKIQAEGLSRSYTSIMAAFLIIGTCYLTLRATRGFDYSAIKDDKTSFAELAKETFFAILSVPRNRILLPLLWAFFIATVGRNLFVSVALYYYEYYLQLPEGRPILLVITAYTLTVLLSLPVWIKISRKYGKIYPAFTGGICMSLTCIFIYPLLPPGELLYPIIVSLAIGFFAGSFVMYDSLVADIADYDTLQHGAHREGLIFGFWKMSHKMARAVGLAVTGYSLNYIGFIEQSKEQPDSVAEGLSIIYGPVVGVFFLLGALLLLLIPWDQKKHARVQRKLYRQNNEEK